MEKIKKIVVDTYILYENEDISFNEFTKEQENIIADIQQFQNENNSDFSGLHVHIADKNPDHDISTIYVVLTTEDMCSLCEKGIDGTSDTFIDEATFY